MAVAISSRGSGIRDQRRLPHRSLGHKGLALGAVAVAASVWALRSCLLTFTTLNVQRSSLRSLLVPASEMAASALLLGSPDRALAEGEQQELRLFQNFQVVYKQPIGSDFFLGGGGASMGTLKTNNPRVVFVKPDSLAYAQGLRIGDEIVIARKGTNSGQWISEGSLRTVPDADRFIKDLSEQRTFADLPAPLGVELIFRYNGVAQPDEDAPDFTLPSSTGGQLSLKDLLQGNKYLVLFFRPGSRFQGGDLAEVKAFNKAQKTLAELNATVACITTDQPAILASQARYSKINYPLLCDYDCSVSKAYGSFFNLDGIGPVADRKTFIIGSDGKVKVSYVTVGWDADKNQIANHVADVVRVLGGNATKAKLEIKPKPKTLGDMLDVMSGQKSPGE